MSLAQLGEFSFIIVGVGVTYNVISGDLLAVAVTVSAITTFITPWMVRGSSEVARSVDRRLPRRLATLVTLYGTWLDRLRTAPRTGSSWVAIRRSGRRVLIDVLFLLALAPAAKAASTRLPGVVVAVACVLLAIPFLLALARNSVELAGRMAREALPKAARDRVDMAETPRRVFKVALQTSLLVLVGIPILAFIQPLIPAWAFVPLIATLFGTLSVVLWRTAKGLDGHVRAGAEVVAEALTRSLPKDKEASAPLDEHLDEAESLLPGLGTVTPHRITEASWAAGRSIAEVDIHGWCGASPVALQRGATGLANPDPSERLQAGDVLVVLGTKGATDATHALLELGPAEAGF